MMNSNFIKLWGIPVILAALSMIGLLVALIGDGVWDGLSWLTLGVPVVTIFWFVGRSRKAAK